MDALRDAGGVEEAREEFFREGIAVGVDGDPALGAMLSGIRNQVW